VVRLLFCWGLSIPVSLAFAYGFYLIFEWPFVSTGGDKAVRPASGKPWVAAEQALDASRTN
jgi:hypothetical protein